jgi:hypothetical protein
VIEAIRARGFWMKKGRLGGVIHCGNINVLFDEDKHKFFKQAVLITNNRRSKRQFLFKNVVRFIIKIVINKIFIHIQSQIISQMLRLQKQCLDLFKDLMKLRKLALC